MRSAGLPSINERSSKMHTSCHGADSVRYLMTAWLVCFIDPICFIDPRRRPTSIR
jgi:hypothetical protein